MQSIINVQTRDNYSIIDITLPNGDDYRIEVSDNHNLLTVTSHEGSMIVQPKVSNQVIIKTEP